MTFGFEIRSATLIDADGANGQMSPRAVLHVARLRDGKAVLVSMAKETAVVLLRALKHAHCRRVPRGLHGQLGQGVLSAVEAEIGPAVEDVVMVALVLDFP